MKINKCSECGNNDFLIGEEIVCKICGLVQTKDKKITKIENHIYISLGKDPITQLDVFNNEESCRIESSENRIDIWFTNDFLNANLSRFLDTIKSIIKNSDIGHISGSFFIIDDSFKYINIATIPQTGLQGLYDNTYNYRVKSDFILVKDDKLFIINITQSPKLIEHKFDKHYTKEVTFKGKNNIKYNQSIEVNENTNTKNVRIVFAPKRLFITRIIQGKDLTEALEILSKELDNIGFKLLEEKNVSTS